MSSLTFLSTATLLVQLLAFGGACHVALVSKKRGWWLLALGTALIMLRRLVDLSAEQGAYLVALHAVTMLGGIILIFKAYQEDVDGLVELANSVPNMVAITDAQGEPIYLNERWKAFTGVGIEGMRHRAWEQLVHQEDVDMVAKAWDSSLASGLPMEVDVRFRSEDGTYRWFLCRASPLRSKRGAVARWYASSTDIHERKEGTLWLSKISNEVAASKGVKAKGVKAKAAVRVSVEEPHGAEELSKEAGANIPAESGTSAEGTATVASAAASPVKDAIRKIFHP